MILLKTLLQEIGEANIAPYAYRLDFNSNQATFQTDANTLYQVDFPVDTKGVMDIRFGLLAPNGIVDTHTNTEEGVPLRIMSTVTTIINKALDQLTPNVILVSASKHDARRMALYRRYITQHLLGYTQDDSLSSAAYATYRKDRAFDPIGLWRKITSFDWTGIKDKS